MEKLAALARVLNLKNDVKFSRMIIDVLSDYVAIKNAKGQYLAVNLASESFLGIKSDEILGKFDHEIFPKDIADKIVEYDRILLEHRVPQEDQIWWYDHLNKENRRLLTLRTPMFDGDKIVGILILSRDITAETFMKDAKERAEEQVLAKIRFFASASHDLRQPIQAMFGLADLLERHVSEEGSKILDRLRSNCGVMKDQINRMLDLSELDLHIFTPQITDFPLSDVLEKIVVAHEQQAIDKGLVFKCDTKINYTIRSDNGSLYRMISNIVENAIRFTEYGEISINCEVIGDFLTINVVDTGIGIKEVDNDLIWDEFHQVGNPGRDRRLGIGLGLPIVRRLSKVLDHPVSFVSTLGKGSVFSIKVPVVGIVINTEETLVEESETKPLAIVVEDDILLQEVFSDLFVEVFGYDVVVATTGAEAIEQFKDNSRSPKVLILDYRLGSETGVDAGNQIRAFFDSQIPGIILTGDPDHVVLDMAEKFGYSFLQKPVTGKELRAKIDEVVKP